MGPDDPDSPIVFQFAMRTRVRFGAGCRFQLPEVLAQEGWRSLGLVVDHNLVDLPMVREMLDDLEEACERVIVEECRIQEPTYVALEEMRGSFSGKSLDAVAGIGGGSALDMAKAMAVLTSNAGPAISYRGFDRMTEPVLPIIAIPTTAGTGSEATPNASFIDTDEKFKLGINGEAVRPGHALLDPELTLSCPRAPTLSAGVDSLVHATEAFVARKSDPLARFFAAEGFRQVYESLPTVLEQPESLLGRSRVMYGAFLSGVALMHSGTGPAAALSYPLGVHYGVPHGIAGAIFLPHVIRHNVGQGVFDYALLTDRVHEGASLSRAEQAERFVEGMFSAWSRIGVPVGLNQIDPPVSRKLMIKDTLKLSMALEQNPVPFGERELESVLSAVGVN